MNDAAIAEFNLKTLVFASTTQCQKELRGLIPNQSRQNHKQNLDLEQATLNRTSIIRRNLHEYITSWKSKFSRVLYLLENCEQIVKSVAVQKDIHSTIEIFPWCANQLLQIHNEAKLLKIPDFDLPTAIEILSSGRYLRSRLADLFTVEPYLFDRLDLKKLDRELRVLLTSFPMPHVFRKHMIIEMGTVTFSTNEFAVTLSMFKANLNILNIEIYVKTSEGNPTFY